MSEPDKGDCLYGVNFVIGIVRHMAEHPQIAANNEWAQKLADAQSSLLALYDEIKGAGK